MFDKNKGLAVSTLVGGGLLVSLFLAIGYASGSIEGLLNFLYSNFWSTFLIFEIIGITSIVIINSRQENPKWETDVLMWGVMTTVFIILVFVPNVIGGVVDYQAELQVTVYNPAFYNPRLETVGINNIQKEGLLSMGQLSLWPSDEAQVRASVYCDGDKVNQKSFGMSVGEQTDTSKSVTIKNLPSGGSCNVDVDLIFEGKIVGQKSESFTIQG